MLNYILTSGFIHSAILLSLCLSPDLNTSSAGKVEVSLIQKEENAPILPTLTKPLIPGKGGGKIKKEQKVDMTQYANQLKALVDPVWVSKINPYQSKLKHQYEIIVLLLVDKRGNIYSIKVKQGSGDQFFDNLAVQTFREIGTIPIPPESVIEHGIEWSLVF